MWVVSATYRSLKGLLWLSNILSVLQARSMAHPHGQQAGAARSASQHDPAPRLLWLHDRFWHPEQRGQGSVPQMPKPALVLTVPLHPRHT